MSTLLPLINRPKSSAGLPRRSGAMAPADAANDAAANSRSRLPSLAGAVSCLSRQPSRLWSTGPPDRPPCVIGEGAFGRVLRGTFKGQPAAIKEVGERPNARRRWRGPGDSPDHDYRREIRGAEFLLKLSHENVVRYLHFDSSSEPGLLYVVMELIDGRNLAELRRKGPFSEDDLRSLMTQTCCGLHYLHSRQPSIIHRDVKGSNIMLSSRDNVAKIVDLGLAVQGAPAVSHSLAGTHRFMAPEVYETRAYSTKSDVFALGCALFELQCGQPPHSDKSNGMAVCYAVMYSPMPRLPDGCNRRLVDFYDRCTRKDPIERPTAKELLGHTFLVGA
ncbi:hypothetical protein BOX15_Mlig026669g1 [Macrostomum lignano]|uniref:Protein kinase domain-containing protein n=1 Tax=Macrostomum lignano TaxID=282301 RepID=A0A267EW07_9PLAT|nr:hypothetical protein BOX15_Mlig026669g1 [Macrostomum lignano]